MYRVTSVVLVEKRALFTREHEVRAGSVSCVLLLGAAVNGTLPCSALKCICYYLFFLL